LDLDDASNYSTLLGVECSGYGVNGHRVMGILPAEGLSTHVSAKSEFIWNVPENWLEFIVRLLF